MGIKKTVLYNIKNIKQLKIKPNKTLVKIGPGSNSNEELVELNIFIPIRSEGKRSLVKCTFLNFKPIHFAKAFDNVDLPVPGKSSINKFPLDNKQITANII